MELADMLRLSAKQVYRIFRSGEIKSVKNSGDVRVAMLWMLAERQHKLKR